MQEPSRLNKSCWFLTFLRTVSITDCQLCSRNLISEMSITLRRLNSSLLLCVHAHVHATVPLLCTAADPFNEVPL